MALLMPQRAGAVRSIKSRHIDKVRAMSAVNPKADIPLRSSHTNSAFAVAAALVDSI